MSVGHRVLISHQQLMFLVYTLHFSATELLLPSSLARDGKERGLDGALGLLLPFGRSGGADAGPYWSAATRTGAGGAVTPPARSVAGPSAHVAHNAVQRRADGPLSAIWWRPSRWRSCRLPRPSPWPCLSSWSPGTALTGTEVLARLAFFFMVIAVSLFSLVVVTLLRLVQQALHLLPLWDQSPLQLVAAQRGPPRDGPRSRGRSFLWRPWSIGRSTAGRGLIAGALIAAVHLMSCTALSIGIFGHSLVAHFAFPIHALFQQITIGEFVERLDVILITICLLGMIVKTATHLWLAVDGGPSSRWGLGQLRALLPRSRPRGRPLDAEASEPALAVRLLHHGLGPRFPSAWGWGVPALLLAASVDPGKGSTGRPTSHPEKRIFGV